MRQRKEKSLEGIQAGRQVAVFKIDSCNGHRLGLVSTTAVGQGGCVDLTDPIIMRVSEAFDAVLDPE